jgi:DME family drug/metabolite transporter
VALAAACGAGVLWGTGAVVVNVLIARHGFAPENISFWRFTIGAVVLLAVFARPGLWRALRPLLATVVAAGTAMAGYVLCWFLGIERIGAAVPTLIALCLPPVIVTVIALLRGQEKLDAGLVVVLAAALVGTVLIVVRHGPSAAGVQGDQVVVGVLCSIASALLYAGFTLVSGRLSSRLGAGPATTCLTVVAAVVMGLAALWRPLHWPAGVPPQAWFLYLGVVTAALALLAFSWGAARLSPMALTVATLVEPLTAVILAALFLGERLGPLQWAGGALLLGSIWGLGRRVAGPHG